MLSKESIDTIAAMIGVKADELAKNISDEQEVKLELPKGRFLTPEQEESVKDAHGKVRYDAGVSKAQKDAFDGKSKDDFLKDIKATILEEVKLEPNQKLIEKEKSIELLQKSLQDKETEIEKVKQESTAARRRSEALAALPKLREDIGIKSNEALDLILSGVTLKDDGIYRGEAQIVDQYQKPVAIGDFLSQEVTSRGWIKAKPQGHGGGEPGAGSSAVPKTYEEFQKHCESKDWKEGSLEAKEYLRTIKAKNPDFEI